MAFVEASFIPRHEYTALEPTRLNGLELIIDELYTAMFALGRNLEGHSAAKVPARLHEVTPSRGGIYLLDLSFLDQDLQETKRTEAEFTQDYWTDVASRVSIRDNGNNERIIPVASYLASYSNGYGLDSSAILEKPLQVTPSPNDLITA